MCVKQKDKPKYLLPKVKSKSFLFCFKWKIRPKQYLCEKSNLFWGGGGLTNCFKDIQNSSKQMWWQFLVKINDNFVTQVLSLFQFNFWMVFCFVINPIKQHKNKTYLTEKCFALKYMKRLFQDNGICNP